ncbi:MAG: hypothetical protein WBD23_00125, partial [Candidatus Acidiferrales bacterium]
TVPRENKPNEPTRMKKWTKFGELTPEKVTAILRSLWRSQPAERSGAATGCLPRTGMAIRL